MMGTDSKGENMIITRYDIPPILYSALLSLLHYYFKDTNIFNLIFDTGAILFTSFSLNLLLYPFFLNEYIKIYIQIKNLDLYLRLFLLLMLMFMSVGGLLALYFWVFEEGGPKDIVYFTGITGYSYILLAGVLWLIYLLSLAVLFFPFFMLTSLVVNLTRR